MYLWEKHEGSICIFKDQRYRELGIINWLNKSKVSKAWYDINNEFFQDVVKKTFLKNLEARYLIAEYRFNAVAQNNPLFLTFAEIKEAEIEEESKFVKTDWKKDVSALSRLGHNVSINTITVGEYYSLLKLHNEEVKASRNGRG